MMPKQRNVRYPVTLNYAAMLLSVTDKRNLE